MDYICKFPSPIGQMLAASDGERLIGLWLCGQKYYGATLKVGAVEKPDLPIFLETRRWLEGYFAGQQNPIDFPLAPRGSSFRHLVWNILRNIPYGQVMSYSEIASYISTETGNSASAQAVGGAVGHNPISILIPCHRVVGCDGSLTGYAAGVDVKLKLLQLEKVPQFLPKSQFFLL